MPGCHRVRTLVVEAGAGQTVLFPSGTLGVDEIVRGLSRGGLRVHRARVYDVVPVRPTTAARRAFESGVDAIVLHSPTAARSLADSGLDLCGPTLICVGPETARAASRAGLRVSVVPARYGDDGIVELLRDRFGASEGVA
jgi:uroporphyrinogen-III synthase